MFFYGNNNWKKNKEKKKMIIYTDGGGWNGKYSKAIVCTDDKIISEINTNKKKTNNEMEYEGMIEALTYVLEENIKNAEIRTDSKLIEGQLNKNWKVKAINLYYLVEHAKRLKRLTKAKIVWIRREKNKAGHLLEK